MTNEHTNTCRNIALDVLRCFLMYLVVLQHTIVYGALPLPELASKSTLFLMGMTFPAVDCFTAISGWFGVRCTIRKLIRLGMLIFFCGTLSLLLCNLFHGVLGGLLFERLGIVTNKMPWCYEVYRYWYLGAYVKLMVLSIVLNPILEWVGKRSRMTIAVSGMVFAGVVYWIKYQFGWESQSWQTLVLVYVFMRIIILLRPARFVWKVVFPLLVCAAIALCAFGRRDILYDYANPITILFGISFVGFASIWHIQEEHWLARFCAYIAPSMISVYMLHMIFVRYCVKPALVILSKSHCADFKLLFFFPFCSFGF